MAIKQVVETWKQNSADNLLVVTEQSYITGSAVVTLEDGSTVSVIEIGDKFLQLVTSIPANTQVRLTYDVRVADTLDVDLLQKIRTLEDQVDKLNKMVDILTKAMDNRVDKHTFRVWLKAMEQSFGKPILDQTLLGIQAVHQSSNN